MGVMGSAMRCRLVPLGALILFMLVSSAPVRAAHPDVAGSAAACENVDYGAREDVTPSSEAAHMGLTPNPNGPTLVGISFFVVNLRDINARTDSFGFRGHLKTSWCDPRLAFEPGKKDSDPRVYAGPDAERLLETIWFPRGYPVNQVGELIVSERVVRIHSDGTVQGNLNVRVSLQTDFDLRRFPFDQQTLELQIESYAYDRDKVVMVAEGSRTGFADGLTLPEWSIRGTSQRVVDIEAIRSDVAFSRVVFAIEITRKNGFYLWKVILPLFIIIAISWAIFWMTEEPLAGRSRISATGVLTVVAYQFVIAESLPRVTYLTLLDQLMIFSFILLFVTVLESMVVSHVKRRHFERGLKIDRTARWVFPSIYLVVVSMIWFTAG